ncbi:Protein CBG06846 [Caenorhabditis briggsae]|uniref:Protein CBG06846 n=1 Tax=Caenorhabditis briggsae TaxID=6238 RepID=A8X374_CAEBR|nr:Protein CBG06846 [Caenorhabditis briggsae]CAP27084.2 Protein CBG06846 [Caenorhabditis briggsae]
MNCRNPQKRMQSQFSTIRNICDRFLNSADSEETRQFRITLQRLRNIKDRFQNKEQLKLARTMTDKLITMPNRLEIRELTLYEYQQYEAIFQNYTQLVDLNIQEMKETRDCSLYSPLLKPPSFSDRFMNEYWIECDNEKKKELEDISDSERFICFIEMNSDEKTLKCDHLCFELAPNPSIMSTLSKRTVGS